MRPETGAYRVSLAAVLAIVSHLDPYGLEPGSRQGAPADEYDLEAREIVSLLIRRGAITADEFDAIWLRWFSETLSSRVSPERMRALIASLDAMVDAPDGPTGPGRS